MVLLFKRKIRTHLDLLSIPLSGGNTFFLLFLTFSVLVATPKKNTLHGGQSRSWSAEHGGEKGLAMGDGGDFGGKRKKRRQDCVGSVAIDPDNLLYRE